MTTISKCGQAASKHEAVDARCTEARWLTGVAFAFTNHVFNKLTRAVDTLHMLLHCYCSTPAGAERQCAVPLQAACWLHAVSYSKERKEKEKGEEEGDRAGECGAHQQLPVLPHASRSAPFRAMTARLQQQAPCEGRSRCRSRCRPCARRGVRHQQQHHVVGEDQSAPCARRQQQQQQQRHRDYEGYYGRQEQRQRQRHPMPPYAHADLPRSAPGRPASGYAQQWPSRPLRG